VPSLAMAPITTTFYNIGGSVPPPLAMVLLITPFTSMLHAGGKSGGDMEYMWGLLSNWAN